jgi:wyosine [tRNA(Phe)-imidazoG37] synthetase (radical SAM superfamily)
MTSKYVYGPVPSRRLGFSLGIDLVPFKYCSYDCIYCQLGKTTKKTIERKEYAPTEKILEEVNIALTMSRRIDYLTFSGSGEPTLHSKIGYMINQLKKITTTPLAVLTNGSLLFRPDVQRDLISADVVLPTLCAVSEKIFNKINRNHPLLSIGTIIRGMIDFRRQYHGKIWLEIMLAKGINDSESEVRKIMEVAGKIAPDKIHLNTVVRPPSEQYAAPLSYRELKKIKQSFGGTCEIIAEFKRKKQTLYSPTKENDILNLIKRRPVTLDDIFHVTGLHKNELLKYLAKLKNEQKIKLTQHKARKYYEVT